MPVIKYEKEDLMPIVLCVLNLLEQDFLQLSLKIAVNTQYQDLKGLVNYDTIDELDVELLKLATDKTVVILLSYVVNLQNWVDSYANIFLLDLDQIYTDKRLVDQAHDIYYAVMFDDVVEDDGYLGAEMTFIFGVMQVLYYVGELVILGRTDPHDDFWALENYDRMFDNTWADYVDAQEYEFRMLANLMLDARDCDRELGDC